MKYVQGITVLIFLSVHFVASASIVTFLDESTWRSALNSSSTFRDDFNQPFQSFLANSSANNLGFSTLNVLGGVNDAGPTGFTGFGYLEGEVDYSGKDKLSLEFKFDAVYGFALVGLINDSLSSPENLNLSELAIDIDNQRFSLADLVGQQKGKVDFLGFISTEEIFGFSLIHGKEIGASNNTSEEFYLDALLLSQPTVKVNEPSSLVLLLIGIASFRMRVPST